MSWEQLAEMRDAGVDIQAHSATHQDLRKPYDKVAKKKLSPEEYEAWLQNEVAGSKQMIEQKLGIKVNCFAVPFGLHQRSRAGVTMKAGYEALFTVYGQRSRCIRRSNDSLGRYLMESNKPKMFTDAVAAIGHDQRRRACRGGSLAVELADPAGGRRNGQEPRCR